VSKVNGESVFDYKGFLEESDPEYKEFFYRYLQIDANGAQSNNQMFNNFITITTTKKNDGSIPEDEIIMTEHVKTSIKLV